MLWSEHLLEKPCRCGLRLVVRAFFGGTLRRREAVRGPAVKVELEGHLGRTQLVDQRDDFAERCHGIFGAVAPALFSVPHNIELMRKMLAGVTPGARLLLVDLWTDPSHTQPGPAALISGEFLVISGEGQAYSEQEADTWLGQTGWKKIEKMPLAGPTSLIVAEAI